MCGRSSLTKTEKEIEARFQATFYSEELVKYNPIPNFNIAPTQRQAVITMSDSHHLRIFQWGLIPSWAKDKSIGSKMINARSETLEEKPAFKRLLPSKRCIIPLDGYYEWKTQGKSKIPFRIITTDQEIFAVAGLWDQWHNGSELVETFTIITIASNTLTAEIHDRMPAILTKENENHWIDEDISGHDAMQLLLPYPSEHMKAYQVSDRVNNVRENDASLTQPVKVNVAIQGELF